MNTLRHNSVHSKRPLNLWIFLTCPLFTQIRLSLSVIVQLKAPSESARWSPSFKQHISDLHVFFDAVLKVILSILIQSFINIKIDFWPPPSLLQKASFQRSDYHSCSDVSGCESRLILQDKWMNIAIKARPVSRTKGWRELGLPPCRLAETPRDSEWRNDGRLPFPCSV